MPQIDEIDPEFNEILQLLKHFDLFPSSGECHSALCVRMDGRSPEAVARHRGHLICEDCLVDVIRTAAVDAGMEIPAGASKLDVLRMVYERRALN